MQTVDKAISLLGKFSEQCPEFGLTALARAAGFDKATTRRLLIALIGHGFVEQDVVTRRYRLGAGLLRLARVREATFPMLATAQALVDALATATGETAHFSLATPRGLATVAIAESTHASRVTLEKGEFLPVHATAAGHVWLAFAEETLARSALTAPRQLHTQQTPVDRVALANAVDTARQAGWAEADQSYEEGVFGIAAPVFDAHGHALGAVAISTPVSRMNVDVRSALRHAACSTAGALSRALGADVPPAVQSAWERA